MIVRFGLDFDTLLPERKETCFGKVTTGPEGLLSLLETQLGLSVPKISPFKRMVQYRLCLQQKDSPERFFHESFRMDPVAVSRTLLNWRDQLYYAGWNGTFPETASRRLKDLAHVEKEASARVAPDQGQRLQSVIRALKDQKTQIEKIELIDAPSGYPWLWQKVLSRFKTETLLIDERPLPERTASDLARLQWALGSILRKEGRVPREIELQQDGSLVVLAAQSRAVSARFLSEYVKNTPSGRQIRIICGDSGHLLDQALETVDVACCGFDSASCFRPLSQALLLALELVWKPVDPFHLQAYLTHPVSPLPPWIRRRLTKALLEAPGIGGRAWQAVLDRVRNESSEKESGDIRTEKILSDIDFWIHCPRYDPAEGAPIDGIRERCDQIAGWLIRMRYAEKNPHTQALYDPAVSQAKDLSESLQALRAAGMKRIDRVKLNQLLNALMDTGSVGLKKTPELGHPIAVESPATLVDPVDEVIWWDFSMPVLPELEPWTVSECRDLEKHHVRLYPLEDRLTHIARTWQRPVMAAEKRLVLVLHHDDEEHHPLWHEIRTLMPHLAQREIELILQADETIPAFPVQASPLKFQPLPPVRRWWRLSDADLLKTRGSESYSSLEAFLFSPFKWVLKYKAKLEPGNLTALPSGNLLFGNLSHRLIEEFFTTHRDWSKWTEEKIHQWLDNRVPELLEKEGGTLLLPGYAAERDVFHASLKQAFPALVKGLNFAGISTVEVESAGTCPFFGGELHCRIDLLLKDPSGREIVLDAKWGGKKYRREALEENVSLQLAVYAFMRKSLTGAVQWPSQAFFIIDDAVFLAQDQKTFPAAELCLPRKEGENTADFWRRLEITWKWRRKQLDDGRIEVPVEGATPDEASEPPEGGLDLSKSIDRFNEYDGLTGWKEGA